jgi:hypothetical protein
VSIKRDPVKKEIDLIVESAKSRDVYRKYARIPKRVMRELGIEPGDFVE